MSKRGDYRGKKGGKNSPRFVQLHLSLMKTDAWQDLDPVSRALYVEIKARFDGSNNGSIGLGCRDAARALNIGKSTVSRAIQSLEDHGFIRKGTLSSFNTNGRQVTEWRLTELLDDRNNAPPSREFQEWKFKSRSGASKKQSQNHLKKQILVPSQVRSVPSQVRNGNIIPHETTLCPTSGTQTSKTGNLASRLRYTYTSSHRPPAKGIESDANQKAIAINAEPLSQTSNRGTPIETIIQKPIFSLIKKMEEIDE